MKKIINFNITNLKQLNSSSKKPPTLLIHDKKAMKKIVAKHEDVMGFFEKIKVTTKVVNKKTNAKNNVTPTKNQQEDCGEI